MSKYKKALQNLVKKLDEISKDPTFQGVFSMAYVHQYYYTGPNWDKELEEAKKALSDDKTSNS